MIEWGSVAQWFATGASILALVLAAWAAWRASRREERKTIDDLKHRLAVAEARLEGQPTAAAFASIREDIAEIRGDTRTASAEIHGLGAGLKRVEHQIGLLYENELRGQQK